MVGGGAPPKTFKAPKSVCVSSLEAGPRSTDLGADDMPRMVVEGDMRIWYDEGLGKRAWWRRAKGEGGRGV